MVRTEGTPLANAEVSVVGRHASARTDAGGRFKIEPDPPLPFTLIVIGPRGEIYDPVEITDHAELAEIRVAAGVVEAITVSTGVAPNIAAPPGAATAVVGREDLEQRMPQHLVDALARTPGVQRRGEGPTAVPVVRGLSGGRTLILLDDARVTAERRAGASATFLDPFTLGAVEVSRGAGSVAYGSDAFGGVIYARPRDPVIGDNSLRYEIAAGAGGSQLSSAGVEFTRDLLGGAILGVVHARHSEGSEGAGGEEIANSSYDDRGASLRFVRAVDRGLFRVALAVNQARDVGAPGADAAVTRTYYPEEDSNRLTFGADFYDVGTWESLQFRGALSSYDIITARERRPNATTTRQISSSDVRADDASFRLMAWRSTPIGKVQTGVDLVSRFNLTAVGKVEEFSPAGARTRITGETAIEDASRFNGGVFATIEKNLHPRLTVNGGVRGDYVTSQNNGGHFGDLSRSDSALSGHVAVTYAFSSAVTTTFQLASGFREPSLSDRYFRGVSGRGFIVGNPDLRPERSYQFDSALRWQRANRSIAFYAYEYRIDDLIERFRNGRDFNFRNRGEAAIRGAEIEFAVPVAAGFALSGGAAVARGEAVDDDAPLDDIAAPTLNLELRWARERFTAFVQSFLVGDDDRPGPVEVERPSYTTTDVGFGWKFSTAADMRVHLRNVFDERYAGSADANAAPAPGRSVSVSLHGRL